MARQRPETDPGILRNRVALAYDWLQASYGLERLTAEQRERWAEDRGLIAPRSWLARRRLARLWREAFREGGLR
jgi:hypothetical protein